MSIHTLNSADCFLKVTINSNSEGAIIIDVNMGMETQQTIQLPFSGESVDFSCSDQSMKLVNVSTVGMNQTVKTNVKSFEFDPSQKRVRVFDGNGSTVYTANTTNSTVIVRVNFNSSTITVFQ